MTRPAAPPDCVRRARAGGRRAGDLAGARPAGAGGGTAYSIELQATIDPATERWISSALDDAASEDAEIAIIRLDTPGGLSDSMRSIIQDMAAAPLPVVVYVSPNGARAASAGAYITEAADVAAMAPGDQHRLGDPDRDRAERRQQRPRPQDQERRRGVDAGARGGHGRNQQLAQLLVTKAKNLTAEEAERAGLIDLISPDQEALVAQLDGFQVKGPKAQTLHTAGLRIENHDMPLQYELLEILVNPNVAYLLLLIGLMGLAIELFSPGLIAPGTIGVISFLLGLYGTAQLPVTATGVLLLVFGVAMIIAEAHLPTHGILGASGVAALIAAGLVLYDTNTSAFEISAPVVILTGLLIGGFLAFAVERAIRARRPAGAHRLGGDDRRRRGGARAARPDRPDLRGGSAVEGGAAPPGAGPEQSAAGSASDGRPLERGSRVRVESVEGLTLRVRPL